MHRPAKEIQRLRDMVARHRLGKPSGICANPKCLKQFTRSTPQQKHCSKKCANASARHRARVIAMERALFHRAEEVAEQARR